MKFKVFIHLIFLFVFIKANAQSVYFRFTDGSERSYLLEDIRKKTFVGNQMSVWLTDGTTYNWQQNQIDFYNYEPDLITTSHSNAKLQPLLLFPNPAKDKLTISFYLYHGENMVFEISSIDGKLLQSIDENNWKEGQNSFDWDLKTSNGQKLPNGEYILRLRTSHLCISKPFIVSE